MAAQDQEATFRRWLDEHIGLMLKVVRGCAASPQDQDDLFQDVLSANLVFHSSFSRRGQRNNLDLSRHLQYRTGLAARGTPTAGGT